MSKMVFSLSLSLLECTNVTNQIDNKGPKSKKWVIEMVKFNADIITKIATNNNYLKNWLDPKYFLKLC